MSRTPVSPYHFRPYLLSLSYLSFDPFIYLISVPLFLRSHVPMVPYALLFLSFAYCFTFGYARCLCAARPFIRQPLIQPDSSLLLCPIRLLILRAALRSFLVASTVYDSSWPLT